MNSLLDKSQLKKPDHGTESIEEQESKRKTRKGRKRGIRSATESRETQRPQPYRRGRDHWRLIPLLMSTPTPPLIRIRHKVNIDTIKGPKKIGTVEVITTAYHHPGEKTPSAVKKACLSVRQEHVGHLHPGTMGGEPRNGETRGKPEKA